MKLCKVRVSEKYVITIPEDIYNQIKAEGKRIMVSAQRSGGRSSPYVFIHDPVKLTKVMLGRYMLKAKSKEVLRFKDDNKFNHSLDNLYLEEK